MTKYYAVCDANGPISIELDGEDESEALASYAALDGRAAIDGCSTDLEDELAIQGDGMSESEFAAALEAAGAEHIRDLEGPICGGWALWCVAEAEDEVAA